MHSFRRKLSSPLINMHSSLRFCLRRRSPPVPSRPFLPSHPPCATITISYRVLPCCAWQNMVEQYSVSFGSIGMFTGIIPYYGCVLRAAFDSHHASALETLQWRGRQLLASRDAADTSAGCGVPCSQGGSTYPEPTSLTAYLWPIIIHECLSNF